VSCIAGFCFGPRERIVYGELDGGSRKQALVEIAGDQPAA